MPYSGAQVWDFLVGREGVEIWLGPGTELGHALGTAYETANGTTGEIRARTEGDKLRLTWRPKDWDHDSTLQITVSGTEQKSTLRFQQEWLTGTDEREEQRAYWTDVTERVVAALAER
ncbi:SRPBCC domain-containing protein [Amycolatopsis sp. cmx-11-51]|uniref:SRPBCC domain-containing protein n=1 Tax=unclassified Amycolatopsis TaxID=2618356 RepID=UPI0039E33859